MNSYKKKDTRKGLFLHIMEVCIRLFSKTLGIIISMIEQLISIVKDK